MVPNSQIDSFISKVEMGVQWFNDAGELLVRMLDRDPDVFTDILAQSNVHWLTRDVLYVFEQIGRKKLAVEAMFLPKHVLNHMLALPPATQAAIATQPVPVVSGITHGRHQVVSKPAAQLTRREAATAIGPQGLRSPEEQARLVMPSHKEETVGRFTVTLMNNRPFIRHSTHKGPATKVLVAAGGSAEIELVKVPPQ
jgi:hypothetical protein